MGGFVKKYAPMMGVFFSIPALIMGTLVFKNFTTAWAKKLAIFLQNDPIFAHYG